MSKLKKLQKKAEYYKSALGSLKEYGGNAELARGIARIALRKPSDLLRKLRWKAVNTLGNVETVELKFPKYTMLVDPKDQGIAAELAVDHVHEPFGTAILKSILRDDMTIVEIGANIGYFMLEEDTHVNVRMIVAIEPNPASFQILSQNVCINDAMANVFNVGISDTDGTLPFYISKHSNISSITPRADYEKKIDVPVMKLDTLLNREKIEAVDLIRMDIEGHEINALRGMAETLAKHHPWLCLEYHTPIISPEDREFFISTLEALDYELKCFTFRWSDYMIFGHNIADRRKVVMTGNLREVLENIQNQVLLLFIAPRDTKFELPEL